VPQLVGQGLEAVHSVAPLGIEGASLAGDIEDAPEPIILGLEEPGRIVEGMRPSGQDDRLHPRKGGNCFNGHGTENLTAGERFRVC
jgi:hypothetical protein